MVPMIMDNQADKDMDDISADIAELQTLLFQTEKQKNDSDAEFAAKLFVS